MAPIRARSRGDGTTAYAVLYRMDERQCSLTFNSEPAAAAFAAAIDAHGPHRALKSHGLNTEPRWHGRTRSPLTVAQWVRQHIDSLDGLEPSVIDNYESVLTGDIEPRPIGAIALAKLSEPDIKAWVSTLQAEGVANRHGRPNRSKTIANKHGFLSGAMNAAVKAGHIPVNPLANRTLPKRKVTEDHEIRMLTGHEFDRLLASTAESWRPMLAFMVASGMRWGEVAALQPEHVDTGRGTVKVRQAWKRSKDGYAIGTPKTKRSRRIINLPAGVLDAIDLRGEWVFTNQRDGGPVRYPAFRRCVWDPAVKSAGLDPPPTPHDLRHTCASWMLAAGQPITTVSRHLGHENISVTADIYADVDRAAFKAAADVMGAMLYGSKTT